MQKFCFGIALLGLFVGVIRLLFFGELSQLACIAASMTLLLTLLNLKRLQQWLQQGQPVEQENSVLLEDIYGMVAADKRRREHDYNALSQKILRLETLARLLPDGVVLMDKRSHVLWSNEMAETLLGICKPDDHGQLISNLVRDNHFARLLELDAEVQNMEFASPQDPELWLELRLINYPNAKLLWVRNQTSSHQLDEMRQNFLSNASHELRTPLAVIMGHVEMLKSSIPGRNEQHSQWLDLIYQHSQRIQKTLDDILLLAYYENDIKDMSPPKKPVNVPALLDQLLTEMNILDAGRHHLSVDQDASLWLYAHRNDLYTIFSNLIKNAILYSSRNGHIRIRWHRDRTNARFQVVDNGPGIDAIHINKLTARFYRIQNAHTNHSGSGLGLTIVQQAMQIYQGQLVIRSTVNSGSSFTCLFPEQHVRKAIEDEKTMPVVDQSNVA